MIWRQVHVGRMQYAPTLPTEKAIPNDRFRVIALRNSLSLSATPNESPPNHGMPIRRTRRKPAEPRQAYSRLRVIVHRLFAVYSGPVCERIRSIECISRGVYDLALRTRGAYAIRPYLTNRKSYP